MAYQAKHTTLALAASHPGYEEERGAMKSPWQAISPSEWLHGWRYPLGAGESVEVVRHFTGHWSAWFITAAGSKTALTTGNTVSFNAAVRVAYERIRLVAAEK